MTKKLEANVFKAFSMDAFLFVCLFVCLFVFFWFCYSVRRTLNMLDEHQLHKTRDVHR